MNRSFFVALAMTWIFFSLGPICCADEAPTTTNRWLVILCSLSGDEEHERKLNQSVKQIVASAEPVFSVPPTRLRVLVGSSETASTIPDAKPCSRGSISDLFSELITKSDVDSEYLFFIIGHAHLDGKNSQFNIDGPDIDQFEYAKLVEKLPGKNQLHWIGLPASGFWIRPLSNPNRTIITATEPDLELTATEMPYALGDILSGTASHSKLEDIDGDGQVTLLDLYLAVNIEVHQRFVSEEYLPTEHAQLDDNGDGRGSELQEPFLPRAEGDPPLRKSVRKVTDGDLARRFRIGVPAIVVPDSGAKD